MELEFRSLEGIDWRVDEGDDGTFDGLACRYGVRDSYGTTFHPKAFRKGGLKGQYALLVMHDPGRVAGTFTAEERDDGLYISGRYDDTQEGRDARTRARSGSARELSVGFVRTDVDWKKLSEMSDEDAEAALANIRGARLVETSQITARMAAVPGSKLKTVRSALGALYAELDAPSLDEQLRAAREKHPAPDVDEQRMDERRRRAALLRLVS